MTRIHGIPWATRLTGAVLALGVAVAHIADQGGVTAFAGGADWIGWAYRLTEVGGAATALLLLVAGGRRLSWAPAALLGVGPALAFVLTRTTGLPGDTSDKGNWGWDVGALSLVVEVTLVIVAVGVLLAPRRERSVRDERMGAPGPRVASVLAHRA